MIHVWLDRWLAKCPYMAKTEVAIFSAAKNMIHVKLRMMVVHLELYPMIPLSVTQQCRQFRLKILYSCAIGNHECKPPSTCSSEIIDIFSF